MRRINHSPWAYTDGGLPHKKPDVIVGVEYTMNAQAQQNQVTTTNGIIRI